MPTVMIKGAIHQYDKGTTFESIVKEYQEQYNNSIALIYFNGKMTRSGVFRLISI